MSDVCTSEHTRRATWRVTSWFASRAYSLGLIAGSGSSYNCCAKHTKLTRIYWHGRRPYILGVDRNAWRCLLKYHHIRGDHIGLGFCAKELPCPTCGSKTAGHTSDCADR